MSVWIILSSGKAPQHSLAEKHNELSKIIQQLADNGNTILIIEHNLDLIKIADYIIDLGPEGGDMGGNIVACGTPKEVAKNPNSYTGQYLKQFFQK